MKSGKRTRIQVSQNNQGRIMRTSFNQEPASVTVTQPSGIFIYYLFPPCPQLAGHTILRILDKIYQTLTCMTDSLTVFPMMMVAGVAVAAVVGVVLLISLIACIVVRKKNSIKHYSGCSTPESLMSPVKQAPRKSPSDMGCLVNSVPTRSHQGPVIYAQLDHSGGQHSDKINKSESVVYADIWKN
ncbi:myelin protein zero-like protein 1 isoform X1 [Alligator mississippiensis]|uniref:myelin protein zero-like protein 1 isoform X1 n=1 Tax=Alligator mississippiensis TaxID=8496 RepID=UPI00071227F1|nr:myelin protein zero-like protein 1 isoform X1 [Alligator mississippiensis]